MTPEDRIRWGEIGIPVLQTIDVAIRGGHEVPASGSRETGPDSVYVVTASITGLLIEDRFESLKGACGLDWRADGRLPKLVEISIQPRIERSIRLRTRQMVRVLFALADGWRHLEFPFSDREVDLRLIGNVAGVLAQDRITERRWDSETLFERWKSGLE